MIVLLVEDNENKMRAISSFYRNEFPRDDLFIADSLIDGLRYARDLAPSFILLDMSLPNRAGATPGHRTSATQAFAGKEFIWRVKRMSFQTKILVVSMFETFGASPNIITLTDIDMEMKDRYPEIYLSAVHYSQSDERWQSEILKFRKTLER